MRITFEIPTSLPSVANLREHWARKAMRTRKLRHDAALLCGQFAPWRLLSAARAHGATITLVRVGLRQLDDDNLASAFKPIRDGLADALKLDDGSALLSWSYEQEKGRPDHVLVTIEAFC